MYTMYMYMYTDDVDTLAIRLGRLLQRQWRGDIVSVTTGEVNLYQ